MLFIYSLLLGIAVSLDAFAAGVAYGMKNITLPFRSLAVVGAVTAACVAAAMLSAHLLGRFIELRLAIVTGSLLLIILGFVNLFQEYLAKRVSPYEIQGDVVPRQLTFSVGRMVISIMAQPETADLDHSLSISWFEAIFLGLALGLDNMVATFAGTLMGRLPLYTPLLMGAIQMAFIGAGRWTSSHLPARLRRQFPFVPGAILIILGLIRLS